MDIVLLVVLAMVASLSLVTTHYVIKKRRKKYNRIRLRRLAGNVTSDEQIWFDKNPNAKYSTAHRIRKRYYTVRDFPNVIRKKIEDYKQGKERDKNIAEAREKRKNQPHKPNEGSLRDSTPIKLVNIANEIGNPDGISEVATGKEFLTDHDSEAEWFQNVPPKIA